MNEYYVEVIETHYIYVEAKTEDEALEMAQIEITSQVPDCVDAKVLDKREV